MATEEREGGVGGAFTAPSLTSPHNTRPTCISRSDMMILLARTGGKDCARSKALSVFLVDLQAAQENGSVTIQGIDAMINHNTNHVFMENLRSPCFCFMGPVFVCWY